jgi:hypothetical protein
MLMPFGNMGARDEAVDHGRVQKDGRCCGRYAALSVMVTA